MSKVYNIRDISSIRDMVETSCELFADNPAFLSRDGETVNTVTYAEAGEDIRALATELTARGCRGKKVAVMGANCYQWALTYLAVCSGVGIIVPVDREYTGEQISYVMRDSGAAMLIHGDGVSTAVESAGLSVPTVKFSELGELVASGKERVAAGDTSYDDYKLNPFDFGVLLYTSGTMGASKGVMLSQYNVCSNVMQAMRVIRVYENDRALSVLPLHHTYECVAGFLSFFFSGASIAYCGSLRTLMKDMQIFQPTVLVVVPLMMSSFYKKIQSTYGNIRGGKAIYRAQTMLARGATDGMRRRLFSPIARVFGGHLRALLCGAAPLPKEIFRAFQSYGFSVFVGYGLTETSPVCMMHTDDYQSPDDVGFPIAGVRARLVDTDENGIGELEVKGNNVMLGYYNNPEATAEVLHGGWFRTGDLAQRKENGAYRITGRTKSMIVAENGKKIFPEELELHLANIEGVSDCLVFRDGEGHITASVLPDDELLAREDAAQYLCAQIAKINEGFPRYKRMDTLVIRRDPFDKTTTQKIKRNSPENLGTEGGIRI